MMMHSTAWEMGSARSGVRLFQIRAEDHHTTCQAENEQACCQVHIDVKTAGHISDHTAHPLHVPIPADDFPQGAGKNMGKPIEKKQYDRYDEQHKSSIVHVCPLQSAGFHHNQRLYQFIPSASAPGFQGR